MAHNAIQIALVWGPLAGFYAQHSAVPLRLQAIAPGRDATWPMSFSISVGVRRADPQLLSRINEALRVQAPAIRRLLQSYGVPLV